MGEEITIMKSTELLDLAISRLPYPDQISNINVTSEPNALTFYWCGQGFRIEEGKHGVGAEQMVKSGGFIRSTTAILMMEVLNYTARQRVPYATRVQMRIDAMEASR